MISQRLVGLTVALLLSTLGCSAASGTEGHSGQVTQALEVGGQCVVADPVVEHSCAHANFGPFASVSAQPHPGFVYADISAPHTNFTVALPGSAGSYQGAVLYSPGADGKYAFFTSPGVSLQVLDGASQPVPEAIGAPIPDALCAQIEQVAVFELSSTQTYTLVYGPTASSSTQTLVEFIGEGRCDVCTSVDLDASLSLAPYAHTEGSAELAAPIGFEVPAQIPVLQGTPHIGTTTFSFRSGSGPWVHCIYAAKQSLGAFKLLGCSGHYRAGDDAEADRFKLRVNPGAALLGPISVELELEDEACHGHDQGEAE